MQVWSRTGRLQQRGAAPIKTADIVTGRGRQLARHSPMARSGLVRPHRCLDRGACFLFGSGDLDKFLLLLVTMNARKLWHRACNWAQSLRCLPLLSMVDRLKALQ